MLVNIIEEGEHLGIKWMRSEFNTNFIYLSHVDDIVNVFENTNSPDDLYIDRMTTIHKSTDFPGMWFIRTYNENCSKETAFQVIQKIYDYRTSLYVLDGKKFKEAEGKFNEMATKR